MDHSVYFTAIRGHLYKAWEQKYPLDYFLKYCLILQTDFNVSFRNIKLMTTKLQKICNPHAVRIEGLMFSIFEKY